MADRTDPVARSVHGTNPQFIISKIVRDKIYSSNYWKEECFGLTAESLIDKAIALQCVGGTCGGSRRPTAFICLVLKLLQIQPDSDIIHEYVHNDQYKYLAALGAFYLRLVGSHVDIYKHLEPLLQSYKRLRYRQLDGSYSILRLDEFVDDCLRREDYLDIDLPSLPKRQALEDAKLLKHERRTALEGDLRFEGAEDEEEDAEKPSFEETGNGVHDKERRRRRSRGKWDSAESQSSDSSTSSEEASRSPSRTNRRKAGRSSRRPKSREKKTRSDRRTQRRRASSDEAPDYGQKSRGRDRERDKRGRAAAVSVRSPPPPSRSSKTQRDSRKKRSPSPSRADEGKRRPEKKRATKSDAIELSVDGWNDLRAQLGIKPLQK